MPQHNNIIYELDKFNNWVIAQIRFTQETKKSISSYVITFENGLGVVTKYARLKNEPRKEMFQKINNN